MSADFPILKYLNHASVMIEDPCGIKLLSDPWFSGYAFDQGWGLRFDNKKALDIAAGATHLWVSHFHDDHMHIPTLKALAGINPEIVFLANCSQNFQMDSVAKGLGFKNIIILGERQEIKLSENFSIERYPVTGIDNMLLIKGGQGENSYTLLNYNDCNLSKLAQRILARKIGPIDLFMSNFNHAGKLLHSKKVDDIIIQNKLIANFKANYEAFHPTWIIPFASYHYYRAPESISQNSSMINGLHLTPTDKRIIGLNIGETLLYNSKEKTFEILKDSESVENAIIPIIRPSGDSSDKLLDAGKSYAKKIHSGFGLLSYLFLSLVIEVYDIGKLFTFSPRSGLTQVDASEALKPDIRCHSSVIYRWFTKKYGTDAFAVGAHFEIASSRKSRLVLLIAAGLLVENKLDAKAILFMLFTKDGFLFLWNRREEILGILFSGKVYADYHNEA